MSQKHHGMRVNIDHIPSHGSGINVDRNSESDVDWHPCHGSGVNVNRDPGVTSRKHHGTRVNIDHISSHRTGINVDHNSESDVDCHPCHGSGVNVNRDPGSHHGSITERGSILTTSRVTEAGSMLTIIWVRCWLASLSRKWGSMLTVIPGHITEASRNEGQYWPHPESRKRDQCWP